LDRFLWGTTAAAHATPAEGRKSTWEKSSSQGKGEGTQEGKAKRKAKEAVGAVSGDKEKKAQGAPIASSVPTKGFLEV